MKTSSIIVGLIFTITILCPFQSVNADNEPNDTFENAERIDEGTHKGEVFYGKAQDTDFYRIPLKKGQRVNVSLKLIETGYVELYVYSVNNTSDLTHFNFVDNNKRTISMNYNDTGKDHDLFLIIRGNGKYSVEVDIRGNSLARDILNHDSGLVGILFFSFIILVLIGLMIMIFIRYYRTREEEFLVIEDGDFDV